MKRGFISCTHPITTDPITIVLHFSDDDPEILKNELMAEGYDHISGEIPNE